MSRGGSGSHWEGCEESHHDCALEKAAEQADDAIYHMALCETIAHLNADLRGARAEIERLREQVRVLREALKRLHDYARCWQESDEDEDADGGKLSMNICRESESAILQSLAATAPEVPSGPVADG